MGWEDALHKVSSIPTIQGFCDSGFFKSRKRAKQGVVGNSGISDSSFNFIAD